MAGKKGQQQLQIEVATDEEWEAVLEKDGLIVVDVYSEWCGPCSAMLNNLKKVKLELGGDNLHLVQAKCDAITSLSRFREKSQPTWMLIAKGKVVNLIFGANSPHILSVVIDELNKEIQAKDGTRARTGWEVAALSPPEQVEFDKKQALEAKRLILEEEKRLKRIRDYKTTLANLILSNFPKNAVILFFPHAKDNVKGILTSDLWEASGLAVSIMERPLITEKMLEELFYFTKTEFNDTEKTNLFSSPSLAYYTKFTVADWEGDVDEVLLKFIYGDMKKPPGDDDAPAQRFKGTISVPRYKLPDSAESTLSIKSDGSLVINSSKLQAYSKIVQSSILIDDPVGTMAADEEAAENDYIEVCGVWVPPDSFTRALAIKLFFPKLYDPIALPELQPIPPCIAITFDILKRYDVFETLKNYEGDLMRYGFFDGDKPGESKLIAKNNEQYGKLKKRVPGLKLVLQISKKKSEVWCVLSQMGPTYMSFNTAIGEEDCKLFFPEGYDDMVFEIEQGVVTATEEVEGGDEEPGEV